LSDHLDLGIEGIAAKANRRALVITSEAQLRTLSSAILNGGLVHARSIVNYHVPSNFSHPNPEAFLKRAISRLGLPGPVVGLMTAVNIKNLSVKGDDEGVPVCCLATAGLSYPVAAGDRISYTSHRSTVNIILIVDGDLNGSATVGAVKTATEAKTLALRDLDVRSRFSREGASGTTTDALCVACTGRGKVLNYSGTATNLGQKIARLVRRSVEEAVQKEDGLTRNRSILSRLKERGIELDDLVETGMELFTDSRSLTKKKVARTLRKRLGSVLSDINVASLIIAAMRLDEEGESGRIPSLSQEAFMKDPIALVTDETIGMAIANYVAGTLGVHNFLYYDREKPGIMKKLEPFMDDAIGGLVSGVMSRILYEDS
jgi:alpha-ribazole phosphatase CobZ